MFWRFILVLLLHFVFNILIKGQSIVLLDTTGTIYFLETEPCSISPVSQIQINRITDISFDSNGFLYAINVVGEIYQVDLNTGSATLIHAFLNLQSFQALGCTDKDVLFAAGSEGYLYSYDLKTRTEHYVGDLGKLDIEDLAVTNGQLYAITRNGELIGVNQNFPSISAEVLSLRSFGPGAGLFLRRDSTSNTPCQSADFYGISEDGNLFSIEIDGDEAFEVCDLEHTFLGATSTIFDHDILDLDSQVVKNTVCGLSNGSITLFAKGGQGQISYRLDSGFFQLDPTFDSLSSGEFEVILQDEEQCLYKEKVTVKNDSGLQYETVIVSQLGCMSEDGSIEVVIGEGFGNITYRLGDRVQSDALFSGLALGSYNLSVIDEMGCQIDTTIELPFRGCEIYIPNAFTPNNDGINDRFQPFAQALPGLFVKSYQIFDRWGNRLFTNQDFSFSESSQWWDGSINGQRVPVGIYLYQLMIDNGHGAIEQFKGTVQLIY